MARTYCRGTVDERLRAHSTRPGGACWEWTGSIGSHGYGMLRLGGQAQLAHRLSFELSNGPIAAGAFVLHRCDNRKCINPAHLFLGDAAANTRDMVLKDRHTRGARARHAKITDEIALAIRASTDCPKAAAARFGVSPSTVSRVRGGKTWSHV